MCADSRAQPDPRARARYRRRHAENATQSPPRRPLPHHRPGNRQGVPLPRRPGPPRLQGPGRPCRGPFQLARPRALHDGQPLPPDHRDDARAHERGHARARPHVHEAFQQAVRTARVPVRRPLHLDVDQGRGSLCERRRVHPAEPGEGRSLRAGRGLALDGDQRATEKLGPRSVPRPRRACEPRGCLRR